MCARISQFSEPFKLQFVDGLDIVDSRLSNIPRRYNGAPGQDLLVIRENHRSSERSLDLIRWGYVPNFNKDAKPKTKLVNIRAETVATSRMFAESYAKRRCIIPVDNFFEWREEGGAKQPYAIGMKDGAPFALAGLWDNWKHPETGEWQRTFAVLTVDANELMAQIHHRMPVILRNEDCERWISEEADPRELLKPYPSEPMRMWRVSRRVNSVREDDPGLVEPEST
ncbi:putative SOS response-associated peptidase YedK [Variibacter gotjawalensis]|uniref:Abasic site processing protein n=1 Tax=Variibacter gotjawalensis TaxID=1333996 RepID=A0A0S3PUZ8_9BRAD|nr:SOS response-associated peptidase [Variibacter gotjawalensis]NIK50041.1 putative SOS response-associated peptidase YedK [Variibacter gotjawalensis]RZS46040.1 putative SOS response-associated peptidase YedK [Variibacter gotjawalensis]BAT59715.1 putative SOS response-associated peptidase YedK [Variibacter gotjawalensis]